MTLIFKRSIFQKINSIKIASFILGISSVGTYMWYIFLYNPCAESIRIKKKSLLLLKKQQITYKKLLKKYSLYKQDNKKLKDAIVLLKKNSFSGDDGFSLMMSSAQENELYSKVVEPYKTKNKKWCMKEYYIVDFEGYYENIINFLKEIESTPFLFKVKQTELSRIKDGMLRLSLDLYFYSHIITPHYEKDS